MRNSTPGIPLAQPIHQAPFQITTERYAGSPHSMAAMQKMARAGETHPDIRRWAVGVVRGVTPKDYLSEVAALYYAVCRQIRYTKDPAHTELVNHPAVTLQQAAGDCDDQADLIRAGMGAMSGSTRAALGAAMGAVGHQVQFTAVGFRERGGPDPYSHVFLRFRDPATGEWAIADPVAGPRTRQMVGKIKTLKGVDV